MATKVTQAGGVIEGPQINAEVSLGQKAPIPNYKLSIQLKSGLSFEVVLGKDGSYSQQLSTSSCWSKYDLVGSRRSVRGRCLRTLI